MVLYHTQCVVYGMVRLWLPEKKRISLEECLNRCWSLINSTSTRNSTSPLTPGKWRNKCNKLLYVQLVDLQNTYILQRYCTAVVGASIVVIIVVGVTTHLPISEHVNVILISRNYQEPPCINRKTEKYFVPRFLAICAISKLCCAFCQLLNCVLILYAISKLCNETTAQFRNGGFWARYTSIG